MSPDDVDDPLLYALVSGNFAVECLCGSESSEFIRAYSRRGPALGGYFSGVSVGLSIRRPSAAPTRFTFASRPLAVGQSYAARQAA